MRETCARSSLASWQLSLGEAATADDKSDIQGANDKGA